MYATSAAVTCCNAACRFLWAHAIQCCILCIVSGTQAAPGLQSEVSVPAIVLSTPPACLQQVTARATVETEYGSLQARTVLPQVQCQLNSKHPSLHLHKGVQQNTSLPLMVATTPPACNIAGDTAAMVLSDRIAVQHKQKDTCLLVAHLSPPLSHNLSVTCVVSAKASHTLDDIMHYVQHRR